MDFVQAKAVINQDETKAIRSSQEQTESTIKSILACVNHRTSGLREKLHAKREDTQLELQMSLDMWTQNIHYEIDDTRKDLHEQLGSKEDRLR
jgi:hypothetical protein